MDFRRTRDNFEFLYDDEKVIPMLIKFYFEDNFFLIKTMAMMMATKVLR